MLRNRSGALRTPVDHLSRGRLVHSRPAARAGPLLSAARPPNPLSVFDFMANQHASVPGLLIRVPAQGCSLRRGCDVDAVGVVTTYSEPDASRIAAAIDLMRLDGRLVDLQPVRYRVKFFALDPIRSGGGLRTSCVSNVRARCSSSELRRVIGRVEEGFTDAQVS